MDWAPGAGSTQASCIEMMMLEALTTVALLTERLLALRANDSKGLRMLLEMGLDELGLDLVDEPTRDFLMSLLSEGECDRSVKWRLGVSFCSQFIAVLLGHFYKEHSSG